MDCSGRFRDGDDSGEEKLEVGKWVRNEVEQGSSGSGSAWERGEERSPIEYSDLFVLQRLLHQTFCLINFNLPLIGFCQVLFSRRFHGGHIGRLHGIHPLQEGQHGLSIFELRWQVVHLLSWLLLSKDNRSACLDMPAQPKCISCSITLSLSQSFTPIHHGIPKI